MIILRNIENGCFFTGRFWEKLMWSRNLSDAQEFSDENEARDFLSKGDNVKVFGGIAYEVVKIIDKRG